VGGFWDGGKNSARLDLSDYPEDNELALLVVVPHTTALRGNRWEIEVPKIFLKSPGVFHIQQIQPISLARFESKLGALTMDEFKRVKRALAQVLNLFD
jgi:mRNA interferase MazF